MRKQFGMFIALGLIIFSTSCKKNEDKPVDTGFLHGIYIVNEGGFNKNNGSMTYYDEIAGFIYPNLFYQVNGRGPGDVIQSFSIVEDLGFIVANNSGRVEVVDMKTFESAGTVIDVDYPRYVIGVTDKKAYLTTGNFGGFVQVINLESLDVDSKIPVGSGPENLILVDNRVFVANSGGWDIDSTVMVIDTEKDVVTDTILVGDNPTDLVKDANGDIWVLCKGKVIYDQNWNVIEETDSRLVQIKIADLSIGKNFVIGNQGDYFSPLHLAISRDGKSLLYVEADGVYKMDIGASAAPLQPIILGSFYGLDVNPENGDIYALKANGFDANGAAFMYDGEGRVMDSLLTGIAPNAVVFN